MRLPKFEKFFPTNTQVHLTIYDDTRDKYNRLTTIYEGDVMCNYQSSSKKTIDNNKLVTINVTTILIFQDILPNKEIINTGEVVFMNEKRNVVKGTKVRDLYGNFQYIALNLE